MLHEALFERALAWVVRQRGEGHVLEARRSFEHATGAIQDHAADYELRITHFLEQYLCDDPELPIAAFATAADGLDDAARQELAGWLRSYRSLFAFAGFDGEGGLLRDCLSGGALRIWPSDLDRRLVPGDLFDGRVVPVGDLLCLSPGRVYHPSEAREPILALLAELERGSRTLARASEATPQPRTALLDRLLAMRSRYLEFESIRAEHVYQLHALGGSPGSTRTTSKRSVPPAS